MTCTVSHRSQGARVLIALCQNKNTNQAGNFLVQRSQVFCGSVQWNIRIKVTSEQDYFPAYRGCPFFTNAYHNACIIMAMSKSIPSHSLFVFQSTIIIKYKHQFLLQLAQKYATWHVFSPAERSQTHCLHSDNNRKEISRSAVMRTFLVSFYYHNHFIINYHCLLL